MSKHHDPQRRDLPRGRKEGRDVFLVFFLYTGSGVTPRPVHSLCIAHGDLINADHAVAAAHVNEGIEGFGSYGDGIIRDRKMYRFPQPFTLDPSGIGRCRLILPSDWAVSDPRLIQVGTLDRTISTASLDTYAIHLDGRTKPTKQVTPRPDAGQVRRFQVLEHP